MALGQIGALDVASITVDALSTAIRFASVELECKSDEARQLLHTAKTVLEVRQALRGQSDESTLAIRRDAVLEDIRTGRIAQGPAHAELKKACDERDNVVMLAALNSAITQGSCAGVPGALILGGVDVLSLQQALATVDRLGGARTDAARHLRRCADTLLELRQAVLASQWNEVPSLVQGNRDATGAAGDDGIDVENGNAGDAYRRCGVEVGLVEDEWRNMESIARCRESLGKGKMGGVVGAIDASTVVTSELGGVIEQVTTWTCKTPLAARLLETCEHVRDMRERVLQSDWAGLKRALVAAREASITDEARLEIRFLQNEVNDRTLCEELTRAMRGGAAGGGIGHLDLATIVVGELNRAILLASDLGCQTDKATSLLKAANVVRPIRACLQIGDWDGLKATLDGAGGKHYGGDSIAAEEVAAALDEWNNRETIERTTMALSHGHAEGTVGHLNFAAVDLNQLDEAIGFAEGVGTKTAEAGAFLDMCKLIRRLRAAEESGEWDRIAFVLKDVDVAGLALEAAQEEVKAAQMELADHECQERLMAALSDGRPTGTSTKII